MLAPALLALPVVWFPQPRLAFFMRTAHRYNSRIPNGKQPMAVRLFMQTAQARTTQMCCWTANGHAVTAAAATAAGIDLSGATALPQGYSWAALSNEDTHGGAALYNFKAATYSNDITVANVAAADVHGTVATSAPGSTSYLLSNTGNAAVAAGTYNAWYATLTAGQKTAVDTAYNSGSLAAYNAQIAALGGTVPRGFRRCSRIHDIGRGHELNLPGPARTYWLIRARPRRQLALPAVLSTANNQGQYTAIGPDGMIAYGASVTVTNGTAKRHHDHQQWRCDSWQ